MTYDEVAGWIAIACLALVVLPLAAVIGLALAAGAYDWIRDR